MQPTGTEKPNSSLERVRHQLRVTGVRSTAEDPARSGVHTRGYLPHVKREGASYFVTFRLADSLPREVLLRIEAERDLQLSRLKQTSKAKPVAEKEAARDFQREIERYLDKGAGACYLRRPDIAQLVAEALQHFDGRRYLLRDWVVMPNHVHAVVWPMPNHLLGDILQSWKQFTSRRAKKLLGLGPKPFWQPESYDHWIRNDEEHARISRYIRNNPVTAGLCARPEDWRWSSAWPTEPRQM